MSQYPPGPSMPPSIPPSMPPSMSPPPNMYGQPGMPMEPSRTSGASIASFVCGLLGCFLITPIVAIILGIVGISATKNPRVTGRGFAIAGIILAILWIGGMGLFGGVTYTYYAKSKPVADVAQQFMTDETSGNLSAAYALCDSSTIQQEELQKLSNDMKPWGAYQSMMIPTRMYLNEGGDGAWQLTGTPRFSSGPKVFQFTIKNENGSYKITQVHYQ